MLANVYAVRLLGFTLGAALLAFLAVLLARHKHARVLLAAVSAGVLWEAANALALLGQVTVGRESGILSEVAHLGRVAAPVLLCHFSVVMASGRWWYAVPFYAAIPAVWFSDSQYSVFLGVNLAAALLWMLASARRQSDRIRRRFHLWFAALLAVLLAAATAGSESALPVIASLGPPACLIWFIYRYNFLGLLISRRVVFAVTLGLVSAMYLLGVKLFAGWAELEFGAFGSFLEIPLTLAAFLVWIPLSAWMTRYLSQRTRIYADFSRRLMEKAVGILDLEQRLQFIAAEIGRTFELRRALVVASGEPPVRGEFGPRTAPEGRSAQDLLRAVAAGHNYKPWLQETGFNYLFPLWYEGRLTGLLLLDTAPRLFLDEYEPILEGLSSQISHSIESCRLIAEKISLERTLIQQEHLATLGTLAARVAHEVRNPLGAIKALAQNMQRDQTLDPRYHRDLDYIVSETDRLNGCVQGVLDFSRPSSAEPRDIPASELLGNIARTLTMQYASRHLSVESQVERDWTVKGVDRQALQQVVLNLALNAVQASPPDSKVWIKGGRQPDGKPFITVSDEGPGIPAEIRERIWEPWMTTKPRGTGLGLSIVARNVQELGGEVRLDSPARGASVTVTLPGV